MTAAVPLAHVVHFTTVHPAGDTRILRKECRTLAEAGYRVTLVAPGAPPPDLGGVEFVSLPSRSSRTQRFALGTFDAARALRALRADLYHLHDPELLPLGGWLRLKGYKVIYDAHESLRDAVRSKPYLPRALAGGVAHAAAVVEQTIGPTLTHLVAATPAIAAQFQFPTTLIANYPVLDEWQKIESTPEAYRVRPPHGAYIGVITTSRGRHEMLAAAALVHEARTDFRLLFAGTIDPRAEAPQGYGVEYAGNLSRPAVVELLSQCRFGVVLFDAMPNHVRSLPTKFFEYLAAGLPVIVSSSLHELVKIIEAERCGLVVDYDDVTGIAKAMRSMLDDPDTAYRMGGRGRRAVFERFAWMTEGEELLRLYAKILSPNEPDSHGRNLGTKRGWPRRVRPW